MADHEFQELLVAPLQQHLAEIEAIAPGARRQLLDLACPDVLYRRLAQGASAAQRAYAQVLSDATHRVIHGLLDRARAECARVRPQWEALDHFERHGTWDGAKAGLLSDETQLGIAVGSFLLPGIGSVIGGAVGGWIAAGRLEEQAGRVLQEYGVWLDQWVERLGAECQSEIWPAVNRDLLRAPAEGLRALPAAAAPARAGGGGVGRWLALGLVVALGAAGARWLWLRRGAAPTPAPAPAPAAIALGGLAGRWQSAEGWRYEAALAGDGLEFRPVASAALPDGAQPGEVHFRLGRGPGAADALRVEAWLRPPAAGGLRYPRVAPADCRLHFEEAGGAPLRAVPGGERLTVELPQLAQDAAAFESRHGRIVRCKAGIAATARRTVVLSRSGPEAPAQAAVTRPRPSGRGRARAGAPQAEPAAPLPRPAPEEKTPAAALGAAEPVEGGPEGE